MVFWRPGVPRPTTTSFQEHTGFGRLRRQGRFSKKQYLHPIVGPSSIPLRGQNWVRAPGWQAMNKHLQYNPPDPARPSPAPCHFKRQDTDTCPLSSVPKQTLQATLCDTYMGYKEDSKRRPTKRSSPPVWLQPCGWALLLPIVTSPWPR